MKNPRSVRTPPRLPAAGRQEAAGPAIWNGTISFSLVAIPVHLVRAVEPGRVSFRLLHKTDYSPLLRRMVCPKEGKVVPPEEIIRGYEIGEDKYILVTDEELESVSPERSRTIEIVEFVDLAEVDPLYFDHPYYLVPAKGGEKAYRLLVEVMRRTRKAGIAKFVLGEREYLVAVRSTAGVLSLVTLHYREEVLSDDEIAPSQETVDPGEKSRIRKVIGKMASGFDPDKYADERRQKILKLLKRKEKGQALVEAPKVEEEEGEGLVDLVAALEESMRKVKGGRS
ncbi:MAG: Ku protein [Deltaproteobacteria bacterium]|nr:Ku protein [Deltaproteobacteria bacterium]